MSDSADRLIVRILERARTPGRACDMDFASPVAAPPAGAHELSEAEVLLGRPLPPIVVRLYRDVGNGGFGPGYGILGLKTGYHEGEDGALSLWRLWATASSEPGYEAWRWPPAMLPFVHWGCAIYSCVDLDSPEVVVWRFSPGEFVEVGADQDEPGLVPTTADEFSSLFVREGPLEEWLTKWIEGRLQFELG